MRKCKILSVIVIVIIAVAMMPASVFAESQTSLSQDGAVVEISGFVTPIDLKASATLSTYLAIDPNLEGADALISPTITIKNDCNAPVEIFASCKSVGTSPVVTAPESKDWDRLSERDTAKFISLGLSGGALQDTIWFSDEADKVPVHLCSLTAGGSKEFVFRGNFGRTIADQKEYTYQLVLEVKLKA